jgi:hypothetical protein
MKPKRSFLQRLNFLKFFSPFGVLVIIACTYFFYNFFVESGKLSTLYNSAIFGLIELEYVFLQASSFTLLIGASFLAIYIIVIGFYIFVYRRSLRTKPVSVSQQGRKVVLDFTGNKFQGFLFVLADLVIYSDSAQSPILAEHQVVGLMKHNSIIFDLSELPSGRYSIRQVNFYVRDPLGCFDAVFIREEVAIVLLLAPINPPDISAIRRLAFTDDSILSQFMVEANESYFASREYRQGDPLKRINWRNTAKHQRLMVRVPEERTIKNSILNIVLNLYVPKAQEVNQTKLVGSFLDAAFAAIDVLIEMPFESVNLLINGAGSQELKEINTYNRDKIHAIIINALVAQSKVPVNSFINEKQVIDPLVFTMSSDLPDSSVNKVVVYKVSEGLDYGVKGVVKDTLFAQQSDLQFENLLTKIKSLNIFSSVNSYAARSNLAKLVEKNEKNLNRNWNIFKK